MCELWDVEVWYSETQTWEVDLINLDEKTAVSFQQAFEYGYWPEFKWLEPARPARIVKQNNQLKRITKWQKDTLFG